MQRALAGDQRAYAALLHETARLLRPLLLRRLGARAEVEDVLQEILLSIHRARHTYDGKRRYRPWAFAIARYRLLDHLRAHYADQLRHAVDLADVAEILPAPVTETGWSYEYIRDEIRQLPERQGVILRLLHQEGRTAREVARLIGMTESAVKVAAHRAYKRLRKILER